VCGGAGGGWQQKQDAQLADGPSNGVQSQLDASCGCKVPLAARYVYCEAARCSPLRSLAAYGCKWDPAGHHPSTSWWNGSSLVFD